MSDLKPEQTDELERLTDIRYLSIQQRPENMNRKQRRALEQRQRGHGTGTLAISARHLDDQRLVYAEMTRG